MIDDFDIDEELLRATNPVFHSPTGTRLRARMGIDTEQQQSITNILKRKDRREERDDLLFDMRYRGGCLLFGLAAGWLIAAATLEKPKPEHVHLLYLGMGAVGMALIIVGFYHMRKGLQRLWRLWMRWWRDT